MAEIAFHDFYGKIPKTTIHQNGYHVCQHGKDTRHFDGRIPCSECEDNRLHGRVTQWRYPYVSPRH